MEKPKALSPRQAVKCAGSQSKLARAFKPPVSRQAVRRWVVAKVIPEARLWQLSQMFPEWFK